MHKIKAHSICVNRWSVTSSIEPIGIRICNSIWSFYIYCSSKTYILSIISWNCIIIFEIIICKSWIISFDITCSSFTSNIVTCEVIWYNFSICSACSSSRFNICSCTIHSCIILKSIFLNDCIKTINICSGTFCCCITIKGIVLNSCITTINICSRTIHSCIILKSIVLNISISTFNKYSRTIFCIILFKNTSIYFCVITGSFWIHSTNVNCSTIFLWICVNIYLRIRWFYFRIYVVCCFIFIECWVFNYCSLSLNITSPTLNSTIIIKSRINNMYVISF